ncbi:MAG: HspR, transcriptional repressor of DnaK operon [Chloroflexi bacterium]|nr:HspR, transcriptional repressor of DnaK operon [Chloroflexota bacterium]
MGLILYRVEVVTDILDIPRVQLRRYEQAGLVVPSGAPEKPRGRARYTEEDLRRIRRIRRLQRDLGLNLAGLQVVMRLLDQVDELQRRVVRQ